MLSYLSELKKKKKNKTTLSLIGTMITENVSFSYMKKQIEFKVVVTTSSLAI